MSCTMKWILSISLLLNTLFLGAAGGLAWKILTRDRTANMWIESEIGSHTAQSVLQAFRDSRANTAPLRKDLRSFRRDVHTLMRADSFDAESYDALMEKILTAQMGIAQERVAMIRNLAPTLPPEERVRLMHKMMTPAPHTSSGQTSGKGFARPLDRKGIMPPPDTPGSQSK